MDGTPATLAEAPDGSRSVGQLRAAPGVIIRGAKTYLVDVLTWFGERVGHLRAFERAGADGQVANGTTQKRIRWVVYGAAVGAAEGADVIGDEATELEALLVARRFLLGALPHLEEVEHARLLPSHRVVKASSRFPGRPPVEGTTYRARDVLSVEQRNQRGSDTWAVVCAVGEEKERLARELAWKWGDAP